MKFFFLLLAGILFIVGYLDQSYLICLSGSILYILIQIVNLSIIVIYERLSNKGRFQIGEFKSGAALFNQLNIFLELVIFFFGAITFIFFPGWLDLGLQTSSGIVAIGQVILWLLSGFVGMFIEQVPIRMGFGGWYIQRKVH